MPHLALSIMLLISSFENFSDLRCGNEGAQPKPGVSVEAIEEFGISGSCRKIGCSKKLSVIAFFPFAPFVF